MVWTVSAYICHKGWISSLYGVCQQCHHIVKLNAAQLTLFTKKNSIPFAKLPDGLHAIDIVSLTRGTTETYGLVE